MDIEPCEMCDGTGKIQEDCYRCTDCSEEFSKLAEEVVTYDDEG